MKGNFNPNPDFEYMDGALAQNGCGVTYMGEFWYFGDDEKVSFITMFGIRTSNNSKPMTGYEL